MTTPAAARGLVLSPPGSGQSPAAAAAADKYAQRRGWRPHLPLRQFAVLLALLGGVVASDVAKGFAPCPSLSYWLRAAAMVPVTLLVLLAVRRHLLAKGAAQRAAGYEAIEGDVEWDARTTLLYPLICSFAGVAAGVFGVGGGIVKVRAAAAMCVDGV